MGRIGRRRWSLAAAPLLVCAALLAGACSNGSSGSESTGPTVPDDAPASSTTVAPTTTTPASYDVPATIDQAYVQRVVSAHDHVLGDAIRVLVRDKSLSDEFLKHLVAIYTEPEFEFQQGIWADSLQQGRLAKTPDSPGDPMTTVIRLERADNHCIITRAETDFAPTLKPGEEQARTAHDQYIVLVRSKPDRDASHLNPTPWIQAFNGSKNDNSVPQNSCDD